MNIILLSAKDEVIRVDAPTIVTGVTNDVALRDLLLVDKSPDNTRQQPILVLLTSIDERVATRVTGVVCFNAVTISVHDVTKDAFLK